MPRTEAVAPRVERLVLLAEAELNPIPDDGRVENLVLENEGSFGLDEDARSGFFDDLVIRVGTFDHRQVEGDLTLPGRLGLDAKPGLVRQFRRSLCDRLHRFCCIAGEREHWAAHLLVICFQVPVFEGSNRLTAVTAVPPVGRELRRLAQRLDLAVHGKAVEGFRFDLLHARLLRAEAPRHLSDRLRLPSSMP